MLGKKDIPPSRGTRLWCIFRLFGISYSFFLLQKFMMEGIIMNPLRMLSKNAHITDRMYVMFQCFLIDVVSLLLYKHQKH